ncbi:uncharacterized protein LOC128397205 [Panonychus citri]|uniref:uncharacterized protein LOC128397205 n=1 Tax=Panonychus citri TaxID=50023 RepID=UPI0023078E11|nr:uncharacterized protein LOC128397205 [Panonychus citri]
MFSPKIQIFITLLILIGTSSCGYLSPPLGFPHSFPVPSAKSFLFQSFGPPVHTYTGYGPYSRYSQGIPPHIHQQQQPPFHPLHSLHNFHGFPNRTPFV